MAKIRINGDTSGYIEISAPNVAGSTSITLPATTGGSLLATDASGNLNVDSGVLYVDGVNNRVGIGTTSPSTLFHVSGGRTYLSSSDGYELAFARTGNFFYFYNDGGNVTGKLSLTTTLGASGEIITFTQDTKRVGIGTTSPGSALTVSTTGSVLSGSNNTFGFYVNPISNGYIYLDALTSSTSNTSLALRTYNNGTYNTVLQSISGNDTTFATAGTERVRIDSSGRLLIGTSTARSIGAIGTHQFSLEGVGYNASSIALVNNENTFQPAYLTLGKSRGTSVNSNTIIQNGDGIGVIDFAAADGDDINSRAARISVEIDGTPGNGDTPGRLLFSTTADGASSPTERMRIQADGQIRVTNNNTNIIYVNTGANGTALCYFQTASAELGKIRINGAGVAYDTTSDYRLKENLEPIANATSRLQALKPWRFNFISHPEATVDGFLAHEAQEVVPEAVGGQKDAVDDNGNPLYQGIDQSKLVPLLTAALQESIKRIEQLEATNASFEARLSALEVNP